MMGTPSNGRVVIVDGYVRVSQVAGRGGESFISPPVQREQIERWAEHHGALVARVYEELDESGGRADRPLLGEAVERVEAGESDGIVVAYMSRFGRSTLDGLLAIKRITDAGGSFVSVQDAGLDFASDSGRFVLRHMLSVAEWDLDRVRTNWRLANERAVARGVFVGGAPFGYRRGKDGRLRVDPRTAPILIELFKRRAGGTSYSDLTHWLTDLGVPSPRGKTQWSAVHSLFRSRAPLGETRWRGVVNANAHPALIEHELWEAAQFTGRRNPPVRWTDLPLLWGLARCANCQRPLVAQMAAGGTSVGTRFYKCGMGRRQQCSSPAHITDHLIEPYVEALFWQQLDKVRRPRRSGRVGRAEKTAAQRDQELEAYRDNRRLPITLGKDRFAAGLAVRLRRAEAARLDLTQARHAASPAPLPPAKELRARWHSMSARDRRDALAEVIDAIFVRIGNRAVETRTFVVLRGGAPSDLPNVQQELLLPTRPLDPNCHPPPPELRPTRDWSRAQLDRELRSFIGGRDRWPSFPEFQAAGRALLWDQVRRHGGALRWANELGIPYAARLRRVTGEPWSDELVHAELAKFLDGRDKWPRYAEFRAADLCPLREAVGAMGGPVRWAERMGVELPPRRRTRSRWTYALMTEGVKTAAAGRKQWPSQREFRAVQLGGLDQTTMKNRRLRDRIAADLGLTIPPRRNPTPDWTDERIREALDVFLKSRSSWPGETEFRNAGLGSLPANFYRNGTRNHWAKQYGLWPVAERHRWTDPEIERALDSLVERHDAWPTAVEFKHAGLAGLRTTLACKEVRERWMRHYGLGPAPRPVKWTNSETERALGEILKDRDTWPSVREMRKAGLSGLDQRLTRTRTHTYWARRYGVRPRGKQAGSALAPVASA
jgi:DNA invertase Pin-like site-specific DNA recombinase